MELWIFIPITLMLLLCNVYKMEKEIYLKTRMTYQGCQCLQRENSFLLDYVKHDDEYNIDYSSISSNEIDTLSAFSL